MKGGVALGLSVLVVAMAALPLEALKKQDAANRPMVSLSPLDEERMSIYGAVLRGWLGGAAPTIHLASLTEPAEPDAPMSGYAACAKGIELETPARLVHRFTSSDAYRLAPQGNVLLTDPKRGDEEIKDNDPGRAIAGGQEVDAAVNNGFAHGLFTFTEIVFDKNHQRAIVSYRFVCGALCGHGETVMMERFNGSWRRSGRGCHQWIS